VTVRVAEWSGTGSKWKWVGMVGSTNIFYNNQATTLYHVAVHVKSAHFEIMISCLQNVCHTLDTVDVAALWVAMECAKRTVVSINSNRVLRQLAK